jgi:hypothetical protein
MLERKLQKRALPSLQGEKGTETIEVRAVEAQGGQRPV